MLERTLDDELREVPLSVDAAEATCQEHARNAAAIRDDLTRYDSRNHRLRFARELVRWAEALRLLGRAAEAAPVLEEALAVYQREGRPGPLLLTRGRLALVERQLGRPDVAVGRLTDLLESAAAPEREAFADTLLEWRGWCAFAAGQRASATADLEAALALRLARAGEARVGLLRHALTVARRRAIVP